MLSPNPDALSHHPFLETLLKLNEGKVTVALLAYAYSGNNQCDSISSRQSAQTVTRLPFLVIKLIIDISNEGDVIACFHSPRLNDAGAKL